MVYQHSISFAAPSQLRLHMVADAEGQAQFAVLNAFNQPIGSLRHLQISLDELREFLDGRIEEAVARNEAATCTFRMGTDMDHATIALTCEEPGKWFKMLDFIVIEEFSELIEKAGEPVEGAQVL
jgi:hypothetical protein